MIKNNIPYTALLSAIAAICTSCTAFVFGNINIDYENNPLDKKLMQYSGADRIADSLKKMHGPVFANPDRDGAFNNWSRCLIMFKEGHKHGENMIHGNFLYKLAPYSQEEFALIHNDAAYPTVEVLSKENATYYERDEHKEGPKDYIRLIGGHLKRWGMTLYFFDKDGKIINDDILKHSGEYQIFYTISDLDDKGRPYNVLDCRGTWKRPRAKKSGETEEEYHRAINNDLSLVDITPIESESLKKYKTYEERAEITPELFHYEYRDTWQHDLMSDGARDMYNMKLLPPLTKTDFIDKYIWDPDQDKVGLKGHITFGSIDIDEGIDPWYNYNKPWPYWIESRKDSYLGGEPGQYSRTSNILPKFYLSVRVMKCKEGKKALIPAEVYKNGININGIQKYRHSTYDFSSKYVCTDFNAPFRTKILKDNGIIKEATEWKEVLRFNIPIKVFCSYFDSDPTAADPYEPFYWYLGREMNMSPSDAKEATSGVQTNAIGGGRGFANWYL